MKKCRCATCGQRFESGTEKKAHKKKHPNESCANVDFKLLKGGNKDMVFGKKKKEKAKPALPPDEDFDLSVEEESDEPIETESEEVKTEILNKRIAELETKIAEAKKQKVTAPEVPVQVPEIEPAPTTPAKQEEEELTEEMAKQILQAHEKRLQAIEFHLRLPVY